MVQTSYITRYMLRRRQCAAYGVRFLLGQSLRSFPRKTSPTLPPARLAVGNVIYLERYAKYNPKFFEKFKS